MNIQTTGLLIYSEVDADLAKRFLNSPRSRILLLTIFSKMKSFIKALGLVGVLLAVAGCAPTHYATTATPDYDPGVSARMRILTGNDLQNASFRPGACYTTRLQSDPLRVDVDDGFLARYKYSSRSVTIGMPASPRPWMRVEGLQFKNMIREYVIRAGQPISLSMSTANDVGSGQFGGYHWSCKATDATFTPSAGLEYDVYLSISGDGRRSRECAIEVRHIDANGLDEPVPTSYAPKCPIPEEASSVRRGP